MSITSKHKKKQKQSYNNKTKKKKTVLHHVFNTNIIKTLPVGFKLYSAKKYKSQEIIDFVKKNRQQKKQVCLIDNLSWLTTKKGSIRYKLYHPTYIMSEWMVKVPTNLLKINHDSYSFLKNLYMNSTIRLQSFLSLEENAIEKMKIKSGQKNPYLFMDHKERCFYEFQFIFGFISVEEQLHFLYFIKECITQGILKDNTFEKKVNNRIMLYNFSDLMFYKNKINRLPMYFFDKIVVLNLCKLLNNGPSYSTPISGIYFYNKKSYFDYLNLEE
jgi:hypothetical protein